MIRLPKFFSRIRSDSRGVTLVEFAFVAPLLMLMLVGTLDLGYAAFVRAVVHGQLDTLTRRISVQGSDSTALEGTMRTRVRYVAGNATITFTKQTLKKFNGLTTPEKVVDDKGAVGYNVTDGDCFEDVNNNHIRDTTSVIDNTIGGADDIILYKATVSFPRILPLNKFIPSLGSNVTIQAQSLAKRQPFESQAAPPIYCG